MRWPYTLARVAEKHQLISRASSDRVFQWMRHFNSWKFNWSRTRVLARLGFYDVWIEKDFHRPGGPQWRWDFWKQLARRRVMVRAMKSTAQAWTRERQYWPDVDARQSEPRYVGVMFDSNSITRNPDAIRTILRSC